MDFGEQAMDYQNTIIPEHGPIRICVIDDDEETLKIVRRILQNRGCQVLTISRPIGSSHEINVFAPQLLIMDINMPAVDGDNLIELYRKTLKTMPRVIFFSGIDPGELEKIRDQHRADDCLYKGDGFFQLIRKVNFHLIDLGLQEPDSKAV